MLMKVGSPRVHFTAPEGSIVCIVRGVCGEEDDITAQRIFGRVEEVANVCLVCATIFADEAKFVLNLHRACTIHINTQRDGRRCQLFMVLSTSVLNP